MGCPTDYDPNIEVQQAIILDFGRYSRFNLYKNHLRYLKLIYFLLHVTFQITKHQEIILLLINA